MNDLVHMECVCVCVCVCVSAGVCVCVWAVHRIVERTCICFIFVIFMFSTLGTKLIESPFIFLISHLLFEVICYVACVCFGLLSWFSCCIYVHNTFWHRIPFFCVEGLLCSVPRSLTPPRSFRCV